MRRESFAPLFRKNLTCLSLLVAKLSGDQENLNHYLGGVTCILNKIEDPKLVFTSVICIQELV